ncbi:hypothetical protein NMY22_g17942 [Coprinellus aureogranulatus]|nr:hypothetical protein NMY22_g17942 [Coprinellus aureogranulatus]
MHHCLRVAEVICSICDVLDRSSALSMALVHKPFLEPALDRVWRSFTSFEPLVACLPNDLFRTEVKGSSKVKILFLRRVLKASDLRRYLEYYSHRVRSFELTDEDCVRWLSIEVLHWQALQIATGWVAGALAPRLTHFEWEAPQHLDWIFGEEMANHFPICMPLFFGSNVTSMEIQVDFHHPLYSAFLEDVSKGLHTRLKSLKFSVNDVPDEQIGEETTVPFLHDYITSASWVNLEEIRLEDGNFFTPYLTSSTLRHLATLPRHHHAPARQSRHTGELCWSNSLHLLPSEGCHIQMVHEPWHLPSFGPFRSIHLYPDFGAAVDRSWKSTDVLDSATHFFVNPFTSRFSYSTIY